MRVLVLNAEIKTFFRQIKLPCELKPTPPASRATAVWDLSLNSQQEGCSTPAPLELSPGSSAVSDFALCNCRLLPTFQWAQASRGSCSPCKRIHAGGSPENVRRSSLESRSGILLPVLLKIFSS